MITPKNTLQERYKPLTDKLPDSLQAWIDQYLNMGVHGVRSEQV